MATALGAEESPAATSIQDIPLLKPSREIPTTFKASFQSWWASNSHDAAASEERLFSRTPFFVPSSSASRSLAQSPTNSNSNGPDQVHGVRASLSFVTLNSPKRFLNTLSILPATANPGHVTTVAAGPSSTSFSSQCPPTVILPGYGAGIGFFYLNTPALGTWAARRNSPVFAVDWLGMGRSARVPFRIKAKREDMPARVDQSERFFTDALEEWRIKQGFEKIALVGHSLGGYLSVAYALRYPTRVTRLILLSPAGVPRDPNGIEEPSPGAPAPDATELKERREALRIAKSNESLFRRFATWAWEEGWSPFQIVRSIVFWGPLLVGKYSSRRFSHLPDDDVRDMHDYIWHITSAKGSGEYCISHLLAPGAYARMPLVDRVADLKIPVTFVYGDNDWMDVNGGRDAVENMRRAGNPDGRLHVVKNAGHHLYLDNPQAVNALLLKELGRPATVRLE